LGPLLPGERVLLFLNGLQDVRDSRFPHAFVGSDDALERRGLGGWLGGDDGGGQGGEGSDDGSGTGHDEGGDATITVWCCVLTFYRVAVFGYRATASGPVPPAEGQDAEVPLPAHLRAPSVSPEFRAAHGRRRPRRAFQMPLAALARAERAPSSAQGGAAPGG
jgi:hypothetical protein